MNTAGAFLSDIFHCANEVGMKRLAKTRGRNQPLISYTVGAVLPVFVRLQMSSEWFKRQGRQKTVKQAMHKRSMACYKWNRQKAKPQAGHCQRPKNSRKLSYA
jgi:hypothetical protein